MSLGKALAKFTVGHPCWGCSEQLKGGRAIHRRLKSMGVALREDRAPPSVGTLCVSFTPVAPCWSRVWHTVDEVLGR